MMTYDFDKVVARRHTGSYKWDSIPDDELPLWVADMDFEVAPAIKQALAERVAHGVFGYTQVGDDYYQAVTEWFKRRHRWNIDPRWMLYTSGVVPATSCAIKALTLPGEKVLVMTPVYNCFFSSIRNQGCQVEESELVRQGNSYVVDWDDFSRKCADEKTTVFLLCNPHNPTGRVWTRDELEKMGRICAENGVFVISDEIHCELVMPGHVFTPFAAVNATNLRNSVTLNSPSKSFNTAGLQIANIICEDDAVRRRIDRVVNIFEVCDVNPFGPVALKAAYNESEDWLDQLNTYIWQLHHAARHLRQGGAGRQRREHGRHLPRLDRHTRHGPEKRRTDRTAGTRGQGARVERDALWPQGRRGLHPRKPRLPTPRVAQGTEEDSKVADGLRRAHRYLLPVIGRVVVGLMGILGLMGTVGVVGSLGKVSFEKSNSNSGMPISGSSR